MSPTLALPPQRLSPEPRRLPLIDAARGAALFAMALYHLVWDLGYFALIPDWVPNDPRFRMFGHGIAASFLLIVGLSLALAGKSSAPSRATWMRLGLIAAAAALITLVTYWAMPEDFIFFGILHCIALSSLLALPLRRAPALVILALALGVFLGSFNVALPLFDQPAFWWTGLGLHEPRSNDWRPLFPWLGFVLLGLSLGRMSAVVGALGRASAGMENGPARLLRWCGRHSLAFYLTHQPVLLAILFVVAGWAGTHPLAEEAPFLRACETQCRQDGDGAICTRVCGCIVARAKPLPLWRHVLTNTLDAEQAKDFDGIAALCVRDQNAPR
jgi:uncharacterized membrane protein